MAFLSKQRLRPLLVSMIVSAIIFIVAGVDAAEIMDVPGWVVPYTGPKEYIAVVGDKIDFTWNTGLHNVYIHPTMNCELDDAVLVGETSPTSYVFTDSDGTPDGNEMFFSCDIGNGAHCLMGQNLVVTVFSNDDVEDEKEETDPEEESEEEEEKKEQEEEKEETPITMVDPTTSPSTSPVIMDAPTIEYTRIDGGNDVGWDERSWYVQVDGVMGGKSSGEMEFISTLPEDDSDNEEIDSIANMMQFTGDISLDGGGFSSVRRRDDLDMSDYAGIVVTLEAEQYNPTTSSSMTGLHLQFDDATSYYDYSSAFAVPLTSPSSSSAITTTTTSVYLPMESFDRGTRIGFNCRDGCSLNEAAINGISIYVLFQEGEFDVRIQSIDAVKEAVAFPSPLVEFATTEDIIELIQSTIRSGGSLYDKSYIELCIAMYWSVLNTIVASTSSTDSIVVPNSIVAVICAGLDKMTTIDETKQDQAWTLRYTMNAVMDDLNSVERQNYFDWLPTTLSSSSNEQIAIGRSEDDGLCIARTSAAPGSMIGTTTPTDGNSNDNDTGDQSSTEIDAILVQSVDNDSNDESSAAVVVAAAVEAGACSTIPEILCSSDDYSMLCSLITSIDGLSETLVAASEEGTTIFAPTNAAVNRFMDEYDADDTNSDEWLLNLLQFHIVDRTEKAMLFETLLCGELISMSNGKNTRILCKDDIPYGIKGIGNDVPADFIENDIIACNSIIHAIDTVLLYLK